ncbi:MAG: hypothetical protein ACI4JJ_06605 [Huintestinicola sp.]
MDKKINGLDSVLASSEKAKQFFGSLPDYIQGGVMLHADSINSEDDLHSCADMVMHEFD